MKLESRVRALEKHQAKNEQGETWQERIAKFLQLVAQGIRFEDVRAIAVGEWETVTSPVLLATKHRDRWERGAPAMIQTITRQHEHFENAD